MTDARFEDGAEGPLRLRATAADDLPVLAALLQDAVLTRGDIAYSHRRRRLDLLLNRFRWEDEAAARRAGRPFERVRSMLSVLDVTALASQGLADLGPDTVLSVLTLDFDPGPDGTGVLVLTLAGDGALRAGVECLNLQLADVTRPYRAPSGKVPRHPGD